MAQSMISICRSWSWDFATLLHLLRQSGTLCLSDKQVCSCFPGCWLHAEMCWSSQVAGLPMWQQRVRAHAQRTACDGRLRAAREALDIPVNLAPNDVVVILGSAQGNGCLLTGHRIRSWAAPQVLPTPCQVNKV